MLDGNHGCADNCNMQVGNSWRTTEDIAPTWQSMLASPFLFHSCRSNKGRGFHLLLLFSLCIKCITRRVSMMQVNLDNSVGLAEYAGPGGWNDLDILEVRHTIFFSDSLQQLFFSHCLSASSEMRLKNGCLCISNTPLVNLRPWQIALASLPLSNRYQVCGPYCQAS